MNLIQAQNWPDLERLFILNKAGVAIINPVFVQNNNRLLNTLREEHPESRLIALVYAFFEPQLLSMFDSVIHISDSQETVLSAVKKVNESSSVADPVFGGDPLSDRETEVLKLMASGMANKEIADKLNISINTVITHRKNISQKTGIKSISGLTIYAVMKKLVSLENLTS